MHWEIRRGYEPGLIGRPGQMRAPRSLMNTKGPAHRRFAETESNHEPSIRYATGLQNACRLSLLEEYRNDEKRQYRENSDCACDGRKQGNWKRDLAPALDKRCPCADGSKRPGTRRECRGRTSSSPPSGRIPKDRCNVTNERGCSCFRSRSAAWTARCSREQRGYRHGFDAGLEAHDGCAP